VGKHLDKIQAALLVRQAGTPQGPGFKKPGSMNKRKTGYMSIKANEARKKLGK
jgi:hypothetical protein